MCAEESWGTQDMNECRTNLAAHVRQLAQVIGERSVRRYENLAAAADYIEEKWREIGYRVERQTYRSGIFAVSNLVVEISGAGTHGEIVVIGAHYDSVAGSPGANDNATGVAALLELSRLFHNKRPARTVRFVAFVNEEPPFYYSSGMGSRVYAKAARKKGENITAMLSLETMGYFSESPGSQRYPFPLGFFYPDRGNFIGFVANLRSMKLVGRAAELFRRNSDFPLQWTAAPGFLPGIGWSDHWSFWKEGYPAFMVTDTAPYRYPFYHSPFDTPDRIDYERLARVVMGLVGVVAGLAD